MMSRSNFYIKNVRCFADEKIFRIRPLTMIVGENSTGKSTLLGAIQSLSDAYLHRGDIDFNDEPYHMGSFVNIVRKKKPTNKSFELGWNHALRNAGEFIYRVEIKEHSTRTEPIITKQSWEGADFKLHFNHSQDRKSNFVMPKIEEKDGLTVCTWAVDQSVGVGDIFLFIRFLRRLEAPSDQIEIDFGGITAEKIISYGRKILEFDRKLRKDFTSLAPLRSAPRRTYDPIFEGHISEGADIPTMLVTLSRTAEGEWEKLRKELVAFGKNSGLFSDVTIRKLSPLQSDPFQIHIEALGPKVNLIDVGYGVSQALPIVVNVMNNDIENLIIQQPEVHLHPKGQAALASLIINQLGKNKGSMCILETHSDYIIDRTRIEIRQGKISPDDVSLIYLEKGQRESIIHNIEFDEKGNFLETPRGFREFFLKETHALLGYEE